MHNSLKYCIHSTSIPNANGPNSQKSVQSKLDFSCYFSVTTPRQESFSDEYNAVIR